ncbi:MAG: hypothetical protein A2156_11505 [Deltaproteobacteria bacterium RBG_16_48_10]|nr:MAG: hypothetical protein A2156_11505 [Deltaproteobacteria bacterium RBG_16_48_10]
MAFKTFRKRLVAWLGPSLAYWTIRVLGWTMKFEEVHPEVPRSLLEQGISGIGAFWHGRLLMMPQVYKGKRLSFLVSPHRDGQVVGRALKRFGFRAILGSTNRKGFSGFKQMLKANQDGSDIALTPDGPRGPRYQVQIGVIELAKLTGRPVVPLTFSASKRKMFKTWDQFLLPFPFSKGVFIWGEPIHVNPKGDRAHLEERRAFLEKCLNELTEKADHYFDKNNSKCQCLDIK